ncbi:hypothetical protein V8C35DRAFT_326633 [Trichoderma chlorosporum]
MWSRIMGRNSDGGQEPEAGSSMSDERDHLSPEDWQNILRRTGALRGWIPREDNGDINITDAPEQLFDLKTMRPNWTTSKGSKKDHVQFQNSTEKNFLEAAFDKTAIETAIQATTPVGGAGLSGGFARSRANNLSSKRSEDVESNYLYHEFPFATVNLPSASLMPSKAFLDYMSQSHDQYVYSHEDQEAFSTILRRFHYLFGTVFARQVLLGGRRYAIQKVYRRNQLTAESLDERNAINASLTVPLTLASIKAGVERSWGLTNSSDNDSKVSIIVDSLAIQGGDETRTLDLETWQDTLEPSKYWKVIKLNNTTVLFPFLLRVLEKQKPKYEHIDFVRALADYAEELRETQKRELAALSEPLRLWVTSSYTQNSRPLFKKRPQWTMMLNTDKPEMVEMVKITIFGYFENGNNRSVEFDGFPDAFPVSVDLPTQKKSAKQYNTDIKVVLSRKYEWRESEPSTVTINFLGSESLIFGVSMTPDSNPITAEFNVHTNQGVSSLGHLLE